MLDFCFLILTILEICLTIFLVKTFIMLENRVNEFHEKIILVVTEALVINDTIRETVKKINKVLRFIANKRFYQVLNILKVSFDTFQIVLFLRSFDYKKGLNYKNIKRLFMSEIARRFLRKILINSANLI